MKKVFAVLVFFASLSAFADSPITCTDGSGHPYSMNTDQSVLQFVSDAADVPTMTAIYPSTLNVKVDRGQPIPAGLIVFSDDPDANPLHGESTSSFSKTLLEFSVTRTGEKTFTATPILIDGGTVILKSALSCTESY